MTAGDLRVDQNGLRLWAEAEEGSLTVSLSGTCDAQTLPTLDSYLTKLHVETTRARPTRVVFDCESLYFMNSSSIKCFVTWLSKIRKLAPDYSCRVHFKTNKRLGWQQRSFAAILRYAPELVSLD